MIVDYILVADYITQEPSGKLTIVGVFSRIATAALPTVHPRMFLVVGFQAPINEFGAIKGIQIKLIDEDGRILFRVSNELFRVPTPAEGHSDVSFPSIFELQHIAFEKSGRHRWVVEINGQTADRGASLDIEVLASPNS